MDELRNPHPMSPANISALPSAVLNDHPHGRPGIRGGISANRHRPAGNGAATAAVPHDVIDRLTVYVAGPQDDRSVAELVARSGETRPDGALMVAAADGELLAAGSMSDGAVVSEASPAGAAAAAVVRYRIASLRRRQGVRRLAAA
jgi:hypothetical protein